MSRGLAILGATGSIGCSTLEIVDAYPDRFRVVSLTGGRNLRRLAEQVRRYRPRMVAVLGMEDADRLRAELGGDCPEIGYGEEGMVRCATADEADLVVSAIVGSAGLVPTLRAIEAGKDVALANKETLVAAGPVVMRAVRENGVRLYPVDSEHSAIFQALQGQQGNTIRRIILTASGGPFRDWPLEKLRQVTREQALDHPNWSMGPKITIDSATMMNKGLEVIEASWLFGLEADRIAVHIHPQSIVHSMVEYLDGSVIAQMGVPDMKAPIAYALAYPERLELPMPHLDLCRLGQLTFQQPDPDRFACLALAYRALELGGTAPAVLNAANEVAVAAFLREEVGFLDIPELIREALERHEVGRLTTVDDALAADRWGRQEVRKLMLERGSERL
ncbi:1-deoxy-D-xylulose 5-phosphate reductoisomerase [Geothermobacter ehrlichii]|uniref:1-deoxy-D-xylulose 5-phosphate reductoisomerase n=1 Tax=Geothermobacter ehrlichii TaxID=213224 RepID=A0A5D3WLE7_9BACT|nr:1-deoxy-D-xylulose-5-phosphate reductoisomerase [Geothermobacter ehrlichii]TYO99532.1 1-deoxy-D-xylulose 5-phosphate reductoisomerase [Geothermobacter ehrlichii]